MRICIIESDLMLREILKEFIELDGHEVRAVENSSEFNYVVSNETFDVVVTDLMWDKDNLVVSTINEILNDMPEVKKIFVYTGLNRDYFKALVGESVANNPLVEYIEKPFSLAEFCKKINNVAKSKGE